MKRLSILFLLVAAAGCKRTEEPVTREQPVAPEPGGTYTSTNPSGTPSTTTPTTPTMPETTTPTPAPAPTTTTTPQHYTVTLKSAAGQKVAGTVDIMDQESGAKIMADLDNPPQGGVNMKLVSACNSPDATAIADIGAIESDQFSGTLDKGQMLEGKAVSIRDKKTDKELACGVIARSGGTTTDTATDTTKPATPPPTPAPNPSY